MLGNTVALAEDVPEQQISRGAASGLYNAAKDAGDVSGPLLSGLVAAQVGLSNLFWLVPPTMLALYGLGLLLVRRLSNRVVAQPEWGV